MSPDMLYGFFMGVFFMGLVGTGLYVWLRYAANKEFKKMVRSIDHEYD